MELKQWMVPRVSIVLTAPDGTETQEWVEALEEADMHYVCSEDLPEGYTWEVEDYEGFYGVTMGTRPELQDVARFANLLVQHGERAAAAYADFDGDLDKVRDALKSHWIFLGDTSVFIKTKTHNKIPENHVCGYIILRQVHDEAPQEFYAYGLSDEVSGIRAENLLGRFQKDLEASARQAVERWT